MSEVWRVIPEFPDYKISNRGRVIKTTTGKLMKESYNKAGHAKVGFVRGGVQTARSIRVLVAEAFVDGDDDIFDTPINLDGDHKNNNDWNLVWRPRWFAIKYARQFHEYTPGQDLGPIHEIGTHRTYDTIQSAALQNGLLIYDVWVSVITRKETRPNRQLFRLKQ